MTKQKPTIRGKNWLTITAVVAFVGVLITTIMRLLTPKQITVPITNFVSQNQDGSQTTFNSITFKGGLPTPVESLSIVNVQTSQTTTEHVLSQIISNYEMEKVSGVDDIWSGPNFNLFYNSQKDEYVFTNNFPQKEELITLDQAERAAQTFIEKNFLNIELSISAEEIRYFKGVWDVEETNSVSRATVVEIPFTYSINGIPGHIEHREKSPIRIMINSENEIQRLIFQPVFLNLTALDEVKTIPIDKALENINNNQASVVSAYETTIGVFTLDEIKSGNLDEVSIEYRLDPIGGIGYPFYRFKGNLINSEGKTLEAEIITPAVVVK